MKIERLTPVDPPGRSEQARASDPKPWPTQPGPETVKFAELVEAFRAPALFDSRPGDVCKLCAIFYALKTLDKATKQTHHCETAEQCKVRARQKLEFYNERKKRKATR